MLQRTENPLWNLAREALAANDEDTVKASQWLRRKGITCLANPSRVGATMTSWLEAIIGGAVCGYWWAEATYPVITAWLGG